MLSGQASLKGTVCVFDSVSGYEHHFLEAASCREIFKRGTQALILKGPHKFTRMLHKLGQAHALRLSRTYVAPFIHDAPGRLAGLRLYKCRKPGRRIGGGLSALGTKSPQEQARSLCPGRARARARPTRDSRAASAGRAHPSHNTHFSRAKAGTNRERQLCHVSGLSQHRLHPVYPRFRPDVSF